MPRPPSRAIAHPGGARCIVAVPQLGDAPGLPERISDLSGTSECPERGSATRSDSGHDRSSVLLSGPPFASPPCGSQSRAPSTTRSCARPPLVSKSAAGSIWNCSRAMNREGAERWQSRPGSGCSVSNNIVPAARRRSHFGGSWTTSRSLQRPIRCPSNRDSRREQPCYGL